MTDIQTNMAELARLRAAVVAHPMCARLEEQGQMILVRYPAGSHPMIDAVRVNGALRGKAWALGQALSRMERHWEEGAP